MKRVLSISVIVLALVALTASAGTESTTYGDGVTLSEAVAIANLLANPDDYVGKKVRVDGVITGVCKKRGCWMQITDPESGEGVRIKVDDGVIVFPYEAMGNEAAAEGIFEAIKLTPEQIEARKAQEAKETGAENCDKDAAKGEGSGAGCDAPAKDQYVYLIRGTGAVIKG
ncbi:MAG: DUF4920 domain-containing protein [Acidobacteriota bacterium]